MSTVKDLIIRLSEAEQDLVTAVNNILQQHQLPFYLFEPIINNVHRQISDGKAAELEAAKVKAASREVGDHDV